jgi:heptaprenyl diphosphate synthase
MRASTKTPGDRGGPATDDRRGEASGSRGEFAAVRRGEADLTALLGAFCFFLSAVEYMVPKPLPFMRLGIANLPILLAIDLLPLPWYLALALVKVVGMSLVSGSLFSYVALFSLAGTLVAALVMRAARKVFGAHVSAVGLSVLGAVFSNAAQIAIAGVFVFGEAARLVAPPFMATGLVTGLLLGLFAEAFAAKSKWYEQAKASAAAGALRG